jgi:membrane protein
VRVPLNARIGWIELLKRTIKEAMEDNCFGMAAQLAYYFFLSLFPALLMVVALSSAFPSNLLDNILNWFGMFTPPQVLDVIRTQLHQIRQSGNTGLLTFGLLGALWSSSSAMTAVVDTLNRAYGVREARPWWRVQALAIIMTIVMSAFVLISFTLVVSGPELAEMIAARVGGGPLLAWTWKILQWPLVFWLISVGFSLLYYLGPDVEQLWPWIVTGSRIATALWLVISLGFRFYVMNFGQFNKMYGTIGAIIVVLLWFYLSGLVLLIGAELNAELEHASPYGKAEGEKVPGEHRHWLFRTRRHGGIGETPEVPGAS